MARRTILIDVGDERASRSCNFSAETCWRRDRSDLNAQIRARMRFRPRLRSCHRRETIMAVTRASSEILLRVRT